MKSIRKWQNRKRKKIVLSAAITGVLLIGTFMVWQQVSPTIGQNLSENKPQGETVNKNIEQFNAAQNIESAPTQSQTRTQTLTQIQAQAEAEAEVSLQPQSVAKPSNVSETNKQEALNLYDQGLKLYYNRQFNEGLALFNKALALDPDCYQALNGKGATYAFLGRYDEGITLIQKALKLKPDFVYGHFNLGLANELASRWDEAIAAYHSALALDAKDVWSYYGIASIYGRQGNVENVVTYLSQAIALDPDVKAVAKDEKDFDPVKNDPRFQALTK